MKKKLKMEQDKKKKTTKFQIVDGKTKRKKVRKKKRKTERYRKIYIFRQPLKAIVIKLTWLISTAIRQALLHRNLRLHDDANPHIIIQMGERGLGG